MAAPQRALRLLPLIALTCAALTACGTTVPLAEVRSAGGDGTSLGLGDPTGSSSTATTGGGSTGTTSGTGTTGTTRSSTGSTAPGSTTSRTTTGATRGTTGTRAPVVSSEKGPVRVGLLYLDGVDTVANALGISGLSTGDAQAQSRAIVAELNAKGGLAGRKIDLRTVKVAAGDASSEAAWSSACAALTQDEKVSYVVSYVTLNATRLSCYAKHGVPVLDDQSGVTDRDGLKYAGTFLAAGEMLPGRSASELVDALWRLGWLTPASKVGTFVYDSATGVEVETKYLVPALARHGLKPTAGARVKDGAGAADQNGTVLKFRSAGVDKVIPIGASPLFLMQAAESQGYRPQYALTSLFGPGALLEGTAPREQLKGAKGIGWSKFLDIGKGTRPGPVSTNETRCFEIMRRSSQQSSSTTVQAFQASLCGVLFLLKDGADRHGLTPQLFATMRAERFAPLPTDAFSIALDPSRADGVAAYRDLAFQDSCGCFQYTSGNRATS